MNLIYLPMRVATLALLTFPFAACLQADISDDRTAAKVNGDPVSAQEFKLLLLDQAANTYNYFKQKHNVDDEADFWTRSYGGEVPIEFARGRALATAVRIKIEQKLAMEKGLMGDISYGSFQESLAAENKRRKETVSMGRVIYGPEQYEERDYFRYLHNNALPKLKEKLAKKELAVSEQEIAKYYESNRETDVKNSDAVKVQIITAVVIEDPNPSHTEREEEVRSKLETIKARLEKGETFSDLAKTDGQTNFSIVEKTFRPESSRTDSIGYPLTLQEARKLSPGETSGIVEELGSLRLVKCMDRIATRYPALEEVKGFIETNLIEKKYEEMIRNLIKEAKVEVVQEVYTSISVR